MFKCILQYEKLSEEKKKALKQFQFFKSFKFIESIYFLFETLKQNNFVERKKKKKRFCSVLFF